MNWKLLAPIVGLVLSVSLTACSTTQTASPDAMKGEKGDAMKGDAMKGEKGDAMKGDAMKGDAMKGEKGDAMKGDAMKSSPQKTPTSKP